ncbi:MAG: flagellar protein FlaG [Saccharospirillum sp.]
MSDFSGGINSLNARPSSAPEGGAARSKANSGNALPAQVMDKAEVRVEASASLYTNAQEGGAKASTSSAEELELAVAKLNDYVQNSERKLNFQLDEEAGVTIIRVFDKQSEELIRQIPSEEAVSLAQKLNQEEPLLLFSAQV